MNSVAASRQAAWADEQRSEFAPIFTSDYDRCRSAPDPADAVYLHLSDLLMALKEALANERGTWLDYGSGTSPYASLLPTATVKKSDFARGTAVDYPLTPGLACPAPANSFEGILSTQVLEHVNNPQAYLHDCWRMLKPNGRLVLTTHGIWEEHGCPRDYWRWTVDGLTEQLRLAGFEVDRCAKLTTGLRGLLQLLIQQHQLFLFERRTTVGLVLHYFGWGIWRYRAAVNRFADRTLARNRVSEDPRASVYLALLVLARKRA
jgi:SAM-dependent methyltransferase